MKIILTCTLGNLVIEHELPELDTKGIPADLIGPAVFNMVGKPVWISSNTCALCVAATLRCCYP